MYYNCTLSTRDQYTLYNVQCTMYTVHQHDSCHNIVKATLEITPNEL